MYRCSNNKIKSDQQHLHSSPTQLVSRCSRQSEDNNKCRVILDPLVACIAPFCGTTEAKYHIHPVGVWERATFPCHWIHPTSACTSISTIRVSSFKVASIICNKCVALGSTPAKKMSSILFGGCLCLRKTILKMQARFGRLGEFRPLSLSVVKYCRA